MLYVGRHGVLEYDELRILAPICSSIFSIGFYTDPDIITHNIRPVLNLPNYNKNALEIWNKRGLDNINFISCADFLKEFDVIVLVHSLEALHDFRGSVSVPIILRTIGQNDAAAEAWISAVRQNVESPFYIVRYSPLERKIAHFAGEDAVIRFGKVASDFGMRLEVDEKILTFGTSLSTRGGACNFGFYMAATAPFPRALVGHQNPPSDFSYPGVLPEEQIELLSRAGVYFSLNTAPASYTLNMIEALAAGCPVVAVGRNVIATDPEVEDRVRLPEAYEVPDLLSGAPLPLSLDSIPQAHYTIGRLLNDKGLADETGRWCRERFLELFESDLIRGQWRAFLSNVLR